MLGQIFPSKYIYGYSSHKRQTYPLTYLFISVGVRMRWEKVGDKKSALKHM